MISPVDILGSEDLFHDVLRVVYFIIYCHVLINVIACFNYDICHIFFHIIEATSPSWNLT